MDWDVDSCVLTSLHQTPKPFFTPTLTSKICKVLEDDEVIVTYRVSTTFVCQDFMDSSWVGSNDVDCYLRVINNSIYVKRIKVLHPGRGVFTRLLLTLLDAVETASIDEIIVESVITEEMRDWCLRHNLRENNHGVASLGGLCVDYSIKVKELQEQLLSHRLYSK